MYNMKLRKWGILQVRERTQIEKRVRNLSCYIVEAQIPKKVKQYIIFLSIHNKAIITWLCDT